jgi:uncharacterized membrane protein YtjA (UPF0391 family)
VFADEQDTTEVSVCFLKRDRASPISPRPPGTEVNMYGWVAAFFVIVILAAFLGVGGIAFSAVEIAKILFFVFVLLLVAEVIMGIQPAE